MGKELIIKRSAHERDLDLELVERWIVQGRTVMQMVEALKALRPYEVTHRLVQRDITAVRGNWLKRAEDYMTTFMEGQLERVRFLQFEALSEYERSKAQANERKEKRTIVSVAKTTDDKGRPASMQDWRFLEEEDNEEDNPPRLDGPLEGVITQGEVTTTTKERIGDVRFLELYLRLLREEREIVGYDPKAPSKKGRNTVVKILLPGAQEVEAEDQEDEDDD